MAQYIKFCIGERTGDTEHFTDMVAKISDGISVSHLQHAMEAFLLDWYADCEWEDDTHEKVWTSHQSLCWLDGDEQVTEAEFKVLRDHMNNQTFNIEQCLTKTS